MSTSELADRLQGLWRQLLAAGLVAILVGTGCGQHSMVATTDSGRTSPATGSRAPGNVSLLHDAGDTPITQFVQGAQRSLDCELYLVTDHGLADALGQATRRGIRVRVILEPEAGSTQLVRGESGVDIVPTPEGVALDHTKSCVRDAGTTSAEVLVGTANWSRSALDKNADLVATLPGSDVAAQQVATTIEADVASQPLPSLPSALSADEAVVSPVNARALLLAFIAQPGDRLLVTSEELRDPQLMAAVTAAAGQKQVQVAAPASERTPAGAQRCSSSLYVHAKVMVLWRQGQPAASFIGSENLSKASLDRNREIGFIEGPAEASAIWSALQPALDCTNTAANRGRPPRPRATEGR